MRGNNKDIRFPHFAGAWKDIQDFKAWSYAMNTFVNPGTSVGILRGNNTRACYMQYGGGWYIQSLYNNTRDGVMYINIDNVFSHIDDVVITTGEIIIG